MAQDGGTRDGIFHGIMDRSLAKARAGLRHAVVGPKKMTGRTKERISPEQAGSC